MSYERERFSQRMHIVCDRIGLPKERRQTILGKRYGRSATTGRNWLTGEKIPDYETILKLCEDANVNVEWLYRGVGLMESTDNKGIMIVSDPDIIKMVHMTETLTTPEKKLVIKEVDLFTQLLQQTIREYTK